MSKRLLVFSGCFIVFYGLLRLTYLIPDLIHGNWPQVWLGSGSRSLTRKMVTILWDTIFNFLFAITPYLVLYRLYPARKIWRSILIMTICIVLAFMISWWGASWLYGRKLYFLPASDIIFLSFRLKNYFNENVFYYLISFVYGIVFYFIRYSRYRELHGKELELQSRKAELSFLRSQVNPHFLFNSLNNIYSLVYQGSAKALEAIAGLSDLLRYMLYDTTEYVALEKEMAYIRKYIELQRLRFDHPIQVDIRTEGELDIVRIAPLLLIPFVENSFKHGYFKGGEAGLTITLICSKEKLYFHCMNAKGEQQKDSGGGIGLENVRRRLTLLYPDRHVLSILNNHSNFMVTLELEHANR